MLAATIPNTHTMKHTALIVEDDPATRHVLATTLGTAGIETIFAETGAAMWQRLKDEPDLIVLDLSLGGIRFESEDAHRMGDLLVAQCALGRSFKMKEKVRIVNVKDDAYGAEFVGLSPATEKFLVELYGAVNIRNF